MDRKYALEWLDALVTLSLDPRKALLKPVTDQDVQKVVYKVAEENEKLQSFIKNQVFSLSKASEVSLFIRQYHAAMILLLDQALKHSRVITQDNALLKPIYEMVISSLDELLSFIEVRFATYMSLDERVPITYLSVTRKELDLRVDHLKSTLFKKSADRELLNIVLHSLSAFVLRCGEETHPVTFRELRYQKDLLNELEALAVESMDVDKAVIELLIYKNFNSKTFIQYLTRKFILEINACENVSQRIESLLLHLKEIKQIPSRREATLNPDNSDLTTALSNWIIQEIGYLKKKEQVADYSQELNVRRDVLPASASSEKVQKLLCNLSVDQLAILLRAADDLKLVTVRSLNNLFKTIAPFLSTPYQENISYGSMRSKSYSVERRDKNIVVDLLQKMVETIREY